MSRGCERLVQAKFRIYKEKIKRGVVDKIDKKSHGTAYVKHLFASEVPPKHVMGLKVFTEKTNDLGIVKGCSEILGC